MTERFVIYSQRGEYKMFTGYDRGDIKLNMYVFADSGVISDYPNIARLEGVVYRYFADKSWMDYWKGFMRADISLYDKGEMELLDSDDKVTRFKMMGEKLTGVWSIVQGEGNRVLFWKNPKDNEDIVCACVAGDCDSNGECITEKLSMVSDVRITDEFSGTGLAAGVHMGHAGRRVLYTNAFIEKMVKKYEGRPSDISVDWNHDSKYKGKITGVKLETKPVHKFIVSGQAGDVVPENAGLSVEYDGSIEWDDKFKIYKVVDAEIKAVSVLAGQKPACSVCYVD